MDYGPLHMRGTTLAEVYIITRISTTQPPDRFRPLTPFLDMSTSCLLPQPLQKENHVGKLRPHILSFDIGTRHLAYCAFHEHHENLVDTNRPIIPPSITHWKVVDLLAVTGTPYDESCTYILAKSWKCSQMRAYLDSRGLSSVGNRAALLDRIHADLKAKGVPKVTGTNLCVIATKLYAYLDSQPWMTECQTVVLENQPCMTNPIMKSVQMLLYGYFLYRGVWCQHVANEQSKSMVYEDSVVCGEGNNECTASAPTSAAPTASTYDSPHQRPLPRIMLTSATNKLKVCSAELTTSGCGECAQNGGKCEGGDELHDSTEITTKPISKHTTTTPTETNKSAAAAAVPDAATCTKKSAYKQRKQEAIVLTRELLAQWHTNAATPTAKRQLCEWIGLLESSCVKEQDDLSDSMLQGLFVLRRDGHGHGGSSNGKKKQRRNAGSKSSKKC